MCPCPAAPFSRQENAPLPARGFPPSAVWMLSVALRSVGFWHRFGGWKARRELQMHLEGASSAAPAAPLCSNPSGFRELIPSPLRVTELITLGVGKMRLNKSDLEQPELD